MSLNQGGSSILQKRLASDKIVNVLDFVMNGGAAKWGTSVTHSADKTMTTPFVFANVFTIDNTKTLTLTQLMPLFVVADDIIINGTIEASGKGCSGGSAGKGCRYTGHAYGLGGIASEAASETRNYCFCGSGGGADAIGAHDGGGAFGTGGVDNSGAGVACALTDTELKEIMFSPFFDFRQIGFGGGGGDAAGNPGIGGGQIVLIAKTITVGSTGSILANATNGNTKGGGGGGGFSALIADDISVHGSATITVTAGTAGGGTGGAGGLGQTVQIEV